MDSEFHKYLDENLPLVTLEEKPTKFKVTIEEHYVQTFEIEATDMEEAMETAEEKYKMGRLVVEHDGMPNAKLMMAEDEFGVETTEWVEF